MPSDNSTTPKSISSKLSSLASQPKVVYAVLVVFISLLVGQLFAFIARYSVNILYSDHWGFYTPIFTKQDWWALFSWQHGPHRQGIGLLVTAVLANLTGWDTRADGFAVAVITCMAMVLALVLKHRLFGGLAVSDAIIPLLFLSLFHYESFIVVPNLSYGAFPVLFIILYCLGLLLENRWWRYTVILSLSFLLTYTGFGLFMGPITTLILGIDLFQNRRQPQFLIDLTFALVISIISNASFFIGYKFDPAIPNFGFSLNYAVQYPIFVSLMLSAFWGWHAFILGQPLAALTGTVLLITLLTVFIWHGRLVLKNGLYYNRLSLIITILVLFSLMFCFNTAVGRTPLGIRYAQVSRYLTLIIPAYLGLYFCLLMVSVSKLRYLLLSGYFAIALIGALPLGLVDSLAAKVYNDKTTWRQCYLELEDIQQCNQLSNFRIFPEIADLPSKLAYLKENRLNLFLDTLK